MHRHAAIPFPETQISQQSHTPSLSADKAAPVNPCYISIQHTLPQKWAQSQRSRTAFLIESALGHLFSHAWKEALLTWYSDQGPSCDQASPPSSTPLVIPTGLALQPTGRHCGPPSPVKPKIYIPHPAPIVYTLALRTLKPCTAKDRERRRQESWVPAAP